MRASPPFSSIWRRRLNSAEMRGLARKDEVSVPDGVAFDRARASRANILWRIGGSFVSSPTESQLRSLGSDDLVVFTPPPSKADPFGKHWGTSPIWIRRTSDALDAFSALRDYELCSPVAGELRRRTPLFTRAHGGDALRHSVVDLHLKSLLSFCVGADEAKKFSFHSHRITIACKLRACDEDWATIQALVRWRSVESASIYARLTPEGHSTKLSRALSVDASSVTTRHLPTIDATDFASAINLAADATMAADADGGADAGTDPQRQ